MPVHKSQDFDPSERDRFEERDVIDYDLYASSDKIGSMTESECLYFNVELV